jgi:hypothetical protein
MILPVLNLCPDEEDEEEDDGDQHHNKDGRVVLHQQHISATQGSITVIYAPLILMRLMVHVDSRVS